MVYTPRPVIRRIALSALLSLSPAPWAAQAQEQPISVYFQPFKGGDLTRLNNAVQEALSQPPFRLEMRPTAQTIIVSAPSRVEIVRKRVSGTFYSFTVAFTRDGSSLGQSQQDCGDETLPECTDQIVQDVKSVAAR
jgi:hypothetical protein